MCPGDDEPANGESQHCVGGGTEKRCSKCLSYKRGISDMIPAFSELLAFSQLGQLCL